MDFVHPVQAVIAGAQGRALAVLAETSATLGPAALGSIALDTDFTSGWTAGRVSTLGPIDVPRIAARFRRRDESNVIDVGTFASLPTVLLDGVPNAVLGARLQSFAIDAAVDEPARCVLRIGTDGELPEGYQGELGRRLAVRLDDGPSDGPVLFTGRVVAIGLSAGNATAPVIVLTAEDRLHRLRMATRTRRLIDVTGVEAIRSTAHDHGLLLDQYTSGEVLTHPLLTQTGQSDLQMVRVWARELGAHVWVDVADETLVLCGHGVEPPLPRPTLGYPKDLASFDGVADLTTQQSSVRVTGWDEDAKVSIEESSGPAPPATSLNDGLDGPQVVLQTMGERVVTLADRVPASPAAAAALARSEHAERARRFVRGTGTCAAIVSELRAGGRVDLEGLGGWFDGGYFVAAVEHRFDRTSGPRTRFRVERADVGTRASSGRRSPLDAGSPRTVSPPDRPDPDRPYPGERADRRRRQDPGKRPDRSGAGESPERYRLSRAPQRPGSPTTRGC